MKISNENCLDERTILMDLILYLSFYYLVKRLVHLPYTDSHHNKDYRRLANLDEVAQASNRQTLSLEACSTINQVKTIKTVIFI